jgi:hypothetical protein
MSENQMLTRKEIVELFNTTNEALLPERRLDAGYLNSVINRAYAATTGTNIAARNFAIRKEINNYIDLATKGIVASATTNHFDLLPPKHPFFLGEHALSTEELRSQRAAWVAADPELAEELRPVVAAAYSHAEGSIERVHAEIRLVALTAAGKISDNVFKYNTPLTAAAAPDSELTTYEDIYEASRAHFLGILVRQQSLTASGLHPFDSSQDRLIRMVYRGDSRDRIVRELSKNEDYQRSLALLENNGPLDPFTAAARADFAEFHEALSNLEDPEVPVDIRAVAAEVITKYDSEDGRVQSAILAGASFSHIKELLADNLGWQGDLSDWESSEYVSNPTEEMAKRWNEFAALYWTLNDLDDEDPRFIPLHEILP